MSPVELENLIGVYRVIVEREPDAERRREAEKRLAELEAMKARGQQLEERLQ